MEHTSVKFERDIVLCPQAIVKKNNFIWQYQLLVVSDHLVSSATIEIAYTIIYNNLLQTAADSNFVGRKKPDCRSQKN